MQCAVIGTYMQEHHHAETRRNVLDLLGAGAVEATVVKAWLDNGALFDGLEVLAVSDGYPQFAREIQPILIRFAFARAHLDDFHERRGE